MRTTAAGWSRRDFGRGLTGLAAVGTAGEALAQPIPSWRTELREVAPRIFAYIQAGGPDIPYSGISNCGFVEGPSSLTAIDSLPAPLQTKAFLAAAARARPGKPFDRLIYTHHHGDHIDGAMWFPQGVEIIGTTFARQAIAAMAPLPPWQAREGWAEGGEPHLRPQPTVLVDRETDLEVGDVAVRLIPARAHTAGDLVVYMPEQKVLFGGDNIFFYVAPYAHWAYLDDWVALCDRLLALDIDVIVPGHGPLGGKRELADMRDYLVLFRAAAKERFDAGMTPGRAAAAMPSFGRFDAWRGARDRLAMNTVRAFHLFDGTATTEMDVAGTNAANAEYEAITGYKPQA